MTSTPPADDFDIILGQAIAAAEFHDQVRDAGAGIPADLLMMSYRPIATVRFPYRGLLLESQARGKPTHEPTGIRKLL
jgi:hypothetical protein